MQKSKLLLKGYLAFFAIVVFWSFSWYCAKIQASSGLGFQTTLFYRKLIASVCAFCFCIASRKSLRVSKKDFLFLFEISIYHIIVYYAILYVFVANSLSSGIVAAICGLQPVFAQIIGSFTKTKKFTKSSLITILIGMIGFVFLFTKDILSFNVNNIKPALIGLSLPFLMSLGSERILLKKDFKVDKVVAMFYIMFIATISFLMIGLFTLDKALLFTIPLQFQFLYTLFYLGVFASFGAFLCMYISLDYFGSVRTSYNSVIIPVIAILMSIPLEGFKCDIYVVIGMLLLSISTFLGIKK